MKTPTYSRQYFFLNKYFLDCTNKLYINRAIGKTPGPFRPLPRIDPSVDILSDE